MLILNPTCLHFFIKYDVQKYLLLKDDKEEEVSQEVHYVILHFPLSPVGVSLPMNILIL